MSRNRRLAAIMFTDISGFTATMHADENHARTVLKRHRQVLEETHNRYHGEILQFFGDGTLSIFDSAVSAVECAVEMQIDLRKEPEVPLRIGIHTGDITYDENGAYGDGVNVASRVENLCEDGGVFITAKVYDDIKNHAWLRATNLGSFDLRNIRIPMILYAVSSKGLSVPSRHTIRRAESSDVGSTMSKTTSPVEGVELYSSIVGYKKKKVATQLAFGLGMWGAHRFYLGKRFSGVLHFVLFLAALAITIDSGFPMIAIYFGIVMLQAVLLAVMSQEDFDVKYNAKVLSRQQQKFKREANSQMDEDPITLLMERGIKEFRDKNYLKAINYFDQILDYDKDGGEAHFYLACCFSKTREKDEAFYHLKEALNSGYTNKKEINHEPTLRFIRSLTEFESKMWPESDLPKALPEPQSDLLDSDAFDPLILDKIEDLGERLERGELTRDEFILAKQKVLRGE